MAKKSRGGNLASVAPDEQWRVESDLRTLMEAEAIERDPKRYKAAKQLAQKKLLEIAAVAGESGADES